MGPSPIGNRPSIGYPLPWKNTQLCKYPTLYYHNFDFEEIYKQFKYKKIAGETLWKHTASD